VNIYRHSCSVGSLIATILANPVHDVDSEIFLLQFRDINPIVGFIPRRIGKPTITIRNLETPWQPSARLLSWLLSILGLQVLCRTTTCPGWHIWGCHTPSWKFKKKQEDAHGTVHAYMWFFETWHLDTRNPDNTKKKNKPASGSSIQRTRHLKSAISVMEFLRRCNMIRIVKAQMFVIYRHFHGIFMDSHWPTTTNPPKKW